MDKSLKFPRPEIWGGIECTINRIDDKFNDQLQYAGHYNRTGDIESIIKLEVKKLRYPILWELHQPDQSTVINWEWSNRQLNKLKQSGIKPIAGLLHHGSGPSFTQLDDDKFPELLASYASAVAHQYPWLEYYTPVNEPLTTARFSGLYGLWYPHKKNDLSFLTMLLQQVKGIVLSMQQIRMVNPAAKLVQTEDLGFVHSTPMLQYQADFENHRRWLTYDLLCGRVKKDHALWNYIIDTGISEEQLSFFQEHTCPPDVMGFNYYVTSERYLDEEIKNYPAYTHGGNGIHQYADTEAVRKGKQNGLGSLLSEAWERYNFPLAVTECHQNCTREEQMRWISEIWNTCLKLCNEGINVKAVTVWSLLGAYNWNSLLTCNTNYYECGAFNILNNKLRPTAIAKLVCSLSKNNTYSHPLLHQKGWWHTTTSQPANSIPLLIVGKTGTLGQGFTKICEQRSIPFIILSRNELDICNEHSIYNAIEKYKPWGIINASGFVRVDDAENKRDECFLINTIGPELMGRICFEKGIQFMTFSSDLVFDGNKKSPYIETDEVRSLNVYGESKAAGEKAVQKVNPLSLIIRTSGFFGPWDQYNFVYNTLDSLKQNKKIIAASDVVISPTYVPDLINAALDLLIDEEHGIWHIANNGMISWADFAKNIASIVGHQKNIIEERPAYAMNWTAKRPLFSVLENEKGIKLPSLENALERYFQQKEF